MSQSLDVAYENASHIEGGAEFPARWKADAASFRSTARAELDLPYGAEAARNRFDLFLPKSAPKGLLIFIHGGWWNSFDKSDWSHYAQGAVERGWAVAMPSYTLAPEARISEITEEIACAVEAAAERVADVPIVIAGHSAGGHLAARMGCDDVDLAQLDRVRRIVPISALTDLAPLRKLKVNDILQIDAFEGMEESPVYHEAPFCEVKLWVGAQEREAFIEHSRWLEKAWLAPLTLAEGQNHFTVLEAMRDKTSALTLLLTPED